MSIQKIIEKRDIKEVLHFTTNRGITGIIASQALKSKERLSKDKYLEHIVKLNCRYRNRDKAWHDYLNLSITSVNFNLFGISKNKWHKDMDGWWCILSFDPVILTHTGVYFTTTNNIYSSVIRARGAEGLEGLFAKKVVRWNGNICTRPNNYPENQPTCEQAEVLYPGELSISFLKHVYVAQQTHASAIESQFDLFNLKPVQCIIKPDLFTF